MSYKSLRCIVVALSLIAIVGITADAMAQDASLDRDAWVKQQALEKEFKELLTGCKFIGRYTVSTSLEETPKGDEYHIENVQKMDDNKWMFVARIKYGSFDMKLPITLVVEWAGETPVIVVDKIEIAGGTYSARVVIHGNKYAATWDGGDYGGHMWGTIEKTEQDDAAADSDDDGQ